MLRKPPLSVWEILQWADAHFERTGQWPIEASGRVHEYPEEKWLNISQSLRHGYRGLPGGWTLAQFLDEFRGKRNPLNLPPLSEEQILRWADAHHLRTGDWPTFYSGSVLDASGERWSAINCALLVGLRGLPGRMSLVRLLRERRGVVRPHSRPDRQVGARRRRRRARAGIKLAAPNGRTVVEQQPRSAAPSNVDLNVEWHSELSYPLILKWADAHYARHGVWPKANGGAIDGALDETWSRVNEALRMGFRGLAAGSSLARLLAEHRGVRKGRLAPLSVEQMLQWADAYRERTGDWPTVESGPLAENQYDSWCGIDGALNAGRRGLSAGSSLARLLDERRGTRRALHNRPLTVEMVLSWAEAYYEQHRKWPAIDSGAIEQSPGETWVAVHVALRAGTRGLPGGSSLPRLLAERRGARHRGKPPDVSEDQILAWADAWHARHAQWPTVKSGRVDGVPDETWSALDMALRCGIRGLPGGSSLPRLLDERRGTRRAIGTRTLTEDTVLAWADAYFARQRKWPTPSSGDIEESPGETWTAVNLALRNGTRGLTAGSSLAKLLIERRGARFHGHPPALTEEQILAWVDSWYARHGRWPLKTSGPIDAAPPEPGARWTARCGPVLVACRAEVPWPSFLAGIEALCGAAHVPPRKPR